MDFNDLKHKKVVSIFLQFLKKIIYFFGVRVGGRPQFPPLETASGSGCVTPSVETLLLTNFYQ